MLCLRAAAALIVLVAVTPAMPAADSSRAAGAVFRECDDCPEMVVVPPGGFLMAGASARGGGRAAESVPIQLPRAFAIGHHEITRRQFAKFVADSGHEPRPGCRSWDPALGRFSEDSRRSWQNPGTPLAPEDVHPVTCVAFADALAYAQWLARETGSRYRLPSEVEWEYAARAGTTAQRPWGDDAAMGCDQANTYDLTADAAYRLGWPHAPCRDGYADLAPVGRFGANAFGLQDMIGNVREWVQDCATGSLIGRPRDARAWEWFGGCRERGLRGGSWQTRSDRSRSGDRGQAPADERADDIGFRVALDLEARKDAAENR